MSLDYSFLYEGDNFTGLHSEIAATALAAQINESPVEENSSGSQLLVAANLATAQVFDELTLEDIKNFDYESHRGPDSNLVADTAFVHWRAYLESKVQANLSDDVSVNDLVSFVGCGSLTRRQSEVRTLLKNSFFRTVIDRDYQTASQDKNWMNVCENYISCALLYLVRQSNHEDVQAASDAITRLIKLQAGKQEEISDLVASKPSRAGNTILGLYHLAYSTTRTAEYLRTGRVTRAESGSSNFEIELQRLLKKAEEFIEANNSPEDIIWTRSVGVSLWTVFNDSIWRQALGTTDTIDALLNELSQREHPIFSLLPSQQDALKSHLLDASQVAVVLQMPTSAGKTLLAEFSILQAFEAYKDDARILYIAPTRALCTQTYRTLAADFSGLRIPVQQASSAFEEDPFESALLSDFKSGVVVSTPEKVDLFLRSHPDWFKSVRLIVVDEAHLLSDKERGVRLELLLSNIRREQPTIKFLLLTPFVKNAKSVATWLGGHRGTPIGVHWRPSRLIVGLAKKKSENKNVSFTIEWKEPHQSHEPPKPLVIQIPKGIKVGTARDNLVALNSKFQRLGLTLGMFPASRTEAEKSARAIAEESPSISDDTLSAEHSFAIALAEAEYGTNSDLAYCLRRGTAFHHAALSPELRFLIEELGRTRKLKYLAATTTLAQGINFPVSTVLVHSIHKPNGGGDLTPSEFWNIAGRAGRVGLADKGLIVFVNAAHDEKWAHYTSQLNEMVVSALLTVLRDALQAPTMKEAYRKYPQIRPFLQYLAHAAVTLTPRGAVASLEELIGASFASASSSNRDDRRMMRDIALRYLSEISGKSKGYLQVADTTGFSSFSFDEIYAKIADDKVLSAGPGEVLSGGSSSIEHLVKMLAFLPELDLALDLGSGQINTAAVAKVLDGWINGKTVEEIAPQFGGTDASALRKAGTYLFSIVSQRISWGAHAYIRGWSLRQSDKKSFPTNDLMLPAYIQHGVHTPEAAVASLFNIPRLVAEPMAEVYREKKGALSPENVPDFRKFIEEAGKEIWEEAVQRSRLNGRVDPKKVQIVWRRMRGLSS